MIYYFSETGKILTMESEKPHIFLAPVYAWRYPRPVEELIMEEVGTIE